MKILLGITLAEPGGAQAFVLGFAKWLKGRGHQVLVMAGDGGWLFDRCREADIPTRRIAHLGRSVNLWKDPRAYREIKKILADWRPDAVHLNSSKMGVLGSFAASSSRLAAGNLCIVYRIGGWSFLEPSARQWLYRLAEKWSAKYKDVIVCVHPGDELTAKALGIRPRGRIVTVPNGMDLAEFDRQLLPRDAARRELGLDGSAFVFGTVANFFPAKDLPRYLDACSIVHKKNPAARFVLIGDGAQRRLIEARRHALGLDQLVLLPGAREDASRLLSAFDAFILPSIKEGMPWSLLEAMAASLPCLVTAVGAHRWMLQDAGWIVPPNDPNKLAAAMLDILHHPDDAVRRGSLARRIVEQRFPLAKTYEENLSALFIQGYNRAET